MCTFSYPLPPLAGQRISSYVTWRFCKESANIFAKWVELWNRKIAAAAAGEGISCCGWHDAKSKNVGFHSFIRTEWLPDWVSEWVTIPKSGQGQLPTFPKSRLKQITEFNRTSNPSICPCAYHWSVIHDEEMWRDKVSLANIIIPSVYPRHAANWYQNVKPESMSY